MLVGLYGVEIVKELQSSDSDSDIDSDSVSNSDSNSYSNSDSNSAVLTMSTAKNNFICNNGDVTLH